jgi:hypothetical protein
MKIFNAFGTVMAAMLLALLPITAFAQVTCTPVFPNIDDNVTIVFHSDEGNAALNNSSGPIYAHTGVITNLSTSSTDWKHVQTTWGIADPKGLMTNAGSNTWTKTFKIRDFYSIPNTETVLKMAFVFRNTSGSIVGRAADGSDIFYDVYPNDGALRTKFLAPTAASFISQSGQNIPVKGAASLQSDMKLFDNGTEVISVVGTALETTLTAGAGFHEIMLVATAGGVSDTSTFSYLTPADLAPQDAPAGTELGINYVDGQTVRLLLHAPGKQNVFVVGDFSNWLPSTDYQMRKTTNNNQWWIEIGGLTPGQYYRFQYLVDGVLKVADPLSTLVLDPWNDPFIPAVTYPNLPAYPAGKTTGVVSIIQPGATPYNWQTTNYVRPDQTKLTVYELLVRDFIARHDYQTMLDTLDYLQNLGINAIEFMPVSEFDGNINWGYGPAFHKALDKYYGPPEVFKALVDECHNRGIAVIVDVVFNQATGASPLAQLYWDSANNRPAANNPWLNATATHPFNVFNDFNHESQATKAYTKNCVKYWIEEYRIDGFRFDLSKGFTQVNSGNDVGLWGQYDASRVAIWKDYADFIWGVDPECYVILEHFADNQEEKELANYGMMFWGNMWGAYKTLALGFGNVAGTSLNQINYKARQWNQPHLIGYMESHDEDRLAYECKNFGSQTSGHDVRTTPVAMKRLEMLSNLFYTVPGPKMLWQFGEMGYDFSINYCANGTINTNCRTDPKPIRWDYLQDPYRNRLRNVTAALLHLRNNYEVFHTTDYQLNIGAGNTRNIFLNGSDLDVLVVANVSSAVSNGSVNFPIAGTWYEYYTGQVLEVATPGQQPMPLQPGEYRLYTSQFVALPPGIIISSSNDLPNTPKSLALAPNPATDQAGVWFSLDKQAEVRLEVFDNMGRLVHSLGTQRMDAGDHQLLLQTAQWPNGIYFVRVLTADGGSATQRLVIGD